MTEESKLKRFFKKLTCRGKAVMPETKKQIRVEIATSVVFEDETEILDWLESVNYVNGGGHDALKMTNDLLTLGRIDIALDKDNFSVTSIVIPAIFKPV